MTNDSRRSLRSWLYVLPSAAAIILVAGCGESGPKAYWVSGTVTLDKKPLAEGDVIFYPQNQTDRAAMGKVSQGAFRFRAAAGKQRVEIQASRPSPTRKTFGMQWPESIIPDRYNTQSTLTAEVSPNGPNQFEFVLESR